MMAALAATAMTLGELLGASAGPAGAIEITDLVLDSRQVTPGAAFLAVQGSRGHGLEHASEALERGAAVILYEPSPAHPAVPAPSLAVAQLKDRLGEIARQFYGRAESRPRLAGVTGTNGKSTVAYLIAQAQTLRGYPCGYIGTLGNGIPPALSPQTLTTPDCLSLHRILGRLDAGHAALEVSSHALAQGRVAGLTFDTAVFTNLSRDHLDYHGDMRAYEAAKARLFQLDGLRHAVVFLDDPFGPELARGLAASVAQIGVSLRSEAYLHGRVVASSLTGISVWVASPAGEAMIDSPLVGDFNAENLLLALGALIAWDVPFAEACTALHRCAALPGRMEVFGGGPAAPWVVVDYAHTPAALERVLRDLRGLSDGELWCVFGCGGNRDAGKRAPMGAAAARLADHVVLTDDNPRAEDPSEIVADIRVGLSTHPNVRLEHDRGKAISAAVACARAGDVVLVAGKGHESWQWIGTEQRAFSDRAAVQAALEARS